MKVTVYGTTWCGYCHAAKQYFDKMGITYKDVDIEKDPLAAAYITQKTQQNGVPVIQIDDDFVIGFDRVKINKLLGI
jgi:glutaredoxin 3